MKIASVTVVWNDEKFIRPHLRMISGLDENIVLIGKKPFKDYYENGLVDEKPDNSEKILRSEFPNVKIYEHDFEYFCGDIFNLGMQKARALGCDVIIKLDPDMLLTDDDWGRFINQVKGGDYDTLLMDYPNGTIAYIKDLDHGVPAHIFPVGLDPHVVKTTQNFINDGVKIRATGRQEIIKDVMVHHLTGFKKKFNDDEIKRIEQLPGFPGWQSAPEEIKQKYAVNTK